MNCKGNGGRVVFGDILHNDINLDISSANSSQHLVGHTWLIGNAANSEFCLVAIKGDT